MNWRQRMTVLQLAAMAASLIVAKILWATTLWYEWIALAVAGACALALGLVPAIQNCKASICSSESLR